MYLKNFSLIAKKQGSYELVPGYDILSVQLLTPEDGEELALTLNGKKKKLKKRDFDTAMLRSGIPKKAVENLWGIINKGSQKWSELISQSFLHKENKAKLEELLILKKEQIK